MAKILKYVYVAAGGDAAKLDAALADLKSSIPSLDWDRDWDEDNEFTATDSFEDDYEDGFKAIPSAEMWNYDGGKPA
jgi:hypothetical protein